MGFSTQTIDAAPAPVEATGIDYLKLLDAAHQVQVGQAINYPALADDNDAQPCGEYPQHPENA